MLTTFQDIGVSKDLNEQFRRHLTKSNETLDIDFSIQVLSSGSWPFQQSFTFGLPTEVIFIMYFIMERLGIFFVVAGEERPQIHKFLFRTTFREKIELAV